MAMLTIETPPLVTTTTSSSSDTPSPTPIEQQQPIAVVQPSPALSSATAAAPPPDSSSSPPPLRAIAEASSPPPKREQTATLGASVARTSRSDIKVTARCPIRKVAFLGDANVGKTSLIAALKRYPRTGTDADQGDEPPPALFETITVRFGNIGISTTVELDDTGGSERYDSLSLTYLRFVDIFVFVYDATTPTSLDAVTSWRERAFSMVEKGRKMVTVLVANKIDDKPYVYGTTTYSAPWIEQAFTGGKQMQTKLGFDHFTSTSAITGRGIEELLRYFVYVEIDRLGGHQFDDGRSANRPIIVLGHGTMVDALQKKKNAGKKDEKHIKTIGSVTASDECGEYGLILEEQYTCVRC